MKLLMKIMKIFIIKIYADNAKNNNDRLIIMMVKMILFMMMMMKKAHML